MGSDLDSNSPRWSSLLQTTEDVARAVATAAASVRSPRTSVVYSSNKDDSDSPIKRIQKQFSKIWKGMSPPKEKARGSYNPEILASHKRQWARFQPHSWDHKSMREPSRMFESIVVLGLHPESDIRGLQTMVSEKNSEGLRRQRSIKDYIHGSHKKLKLEPQVLFVYPPEKQLPLKYKDLISFCFPGGVEVNTIERTPSMSELNEILIGQDHFRQSDLSFVFRLQVADDSTLYGCCVLVEEIVQKPSGLISMISDEHSPPLPLTRHVFTTLRCYCILSKLPFFDMHFGMLKSIFIEERLDRISKGVNILNLMSPEQSEEGNGSEPSADGPINPHLAEVLIGSSGGSEMTDMPIHEASKELPDPENVDDSYQKPDSDSQLIIEEVSEQEGIEQEKELKSEFSIQNSSDLTPSSGRSLNKESSCKPLPGVVFPLLRHHACESSESSTSFQDSPSEDRNCRSDMDDTDASSSGQEDFGDHQDILKWAKANGHGALQIICEYYRLKLPERGASLTFHPLEHLHPVLYQRPMEPVLHVSGSAISLKLDSYLDVAEAYSALVAEEEVTALSIWTLACICGNLRLDNILTMIAGALLEKQIVVVCSDVGLLSASVLSMIPLIWPYRWQSLLMTVLPNDMLDFLDAPVPYIVGMRNITTEVQSKTSNSILVDVNKNQVRCLTIPQLPRQRELFSSLSSYHAALVGESYLAKRRPVYEYTEAQAEAAKGFLITLRHYLESFCSNLRAHTITSVQSNDDKVSLLWRESFIDSFPSRDRSFMKLFVDTQLFSVYTDLALSVYQKE